jgi:aldehyde dehydrogenase (NAD+)
MLTFDSLLIGTKWTRPAGSEWLEVVSPSTEAVCGRVPAGTTEDVDAAVNAARAAFDSGPWRRLSVKERAGYLHAIASILMEQVERITRIQIDEMGAPYSWMCSQTAGAITNIDRYAREAAELPVRELRDGSQGSVMVLRHPVGVVGAIIPWNGPVALALGKIVPALLTGCSIILKPAPETPLSANLIAEAAVEAGLPAGVLSIIPAGREVSEHLVTHPGVDRVAFTGSTAAGARIAGLCGERLRRVTLELGGKSAAIVSRDADIDRHMATIISSCIPNTGQVCYATTRLLVPHERAAFITGRLVDAVSKLKIGDPHSDDTYFGPLAAERQRDRVERYIAQGLSEGATLAMGGDRPRDLDRGWYVNPTIFCNVDNSMVIAREEIFGPVISIIEYRSEDEAVAIANDSEYGLGGAIFTDDPEHGLNLATRIETGTCRINEAPPGGGGGPFGGVKRSGLGREHSREGLESYYELKSVSLPSNYLGLTLDGPSD